MKSVLKGNFEPKKQVEVAESDADAPTEDSLSEAFRKAALHGIGGSMVYVDRTELSWDGGDSDDE